MLRVENNQINIIPETIGNLSNLETLMLSGNQLFSLPQSICNLNNLIDIFETKSHSIYLFDPSFFLYVNCDG